MTAFNYGDWTKRVEQELKGAAVDTLIARGDDGLPILPLYVRDERLAALDPRRPGEPSGLPGIWPYVRGSRAPAGGAAGWELAQDYAHCEPAQLQRALLEDLEGGANGFVLQLDGEARGMPASAPGSGFALRSLADLEQALEGVELGICSAALEPGANVLPAGALLVALLRRRGVPTFDLALDFGCDPLGALARDGQLPGTPAEFEGEALELAQWCQQHAPSARVLCASAVPYSRAGAHAVQELAFALATAVEYLRWLERGGLPLEQAATRIGMAFELDADVFTGIAKLRAARLLWSKVLAAAGLEQCPPPWIRATGAERMFARRDAWNNSLRSTLACFSAVCGGADSIGTRAHDALLAEPSRIGRRVARNTPILLGEEAQLSGLLDPAGGSHYVEARTRALARAAYALFREIESRGGMLADLLQDSVRARVDRHWAERRARLVQGRQPVLGVSAFPPEQALPPAPSAARGPARQASPAVRVPRLPPGAGRGARFEGLVNAAGGGAALSDLVRSLERTTASKRIEAFPLRRDAAPFEDLCARAAAGPRPVRILLCKLGPLAEHGARAGFARQLFHSGGFELHELEVLDTAGLAAIPGVCAQIRAGSACVCGSDERYKLLALESVRALKAVGIGQILLAGKPGALESALVAAGLSGHFALGQDLHAVLQALLDSQGDASSALPRGASR